MEHGMTELWILTRKYDFDYLLHIRRVMFLAPEVQAMIKSPMGVATHHGDEYEITANKADVAVPIQSIPERWAHLISFCSFEFAIFWKSLEADTESTVSMEREDQGDQINQCIMGR